MIWWCNLTFQNPLPGASREVTVQLDEVSPIVECGFFPDTNSINHYWILWHPEYKRKQWKPTRSVSSFDPTSKDDILYDPRTAKPMNAKQEHVYIQQLKNRIKKPRPRTCQRGWDVGRGELVLATFLWGGEAVGKREGSEGGEQETGSRRPEARRFNRNPAPTRKAPRTSGW